MRRRKKHMEYLFISGVGILIATTLFMTHKVNKTEIQEPVTEVMEVELPVTDDEPHYAGLTEQLRQSLSEVDLTQINIEEEKQETISSFYIDKITLLDTDTKVEWKTGYINATASVMNLPEKDAKTYEQYKLNKKIKYVEHDDTWARIYYGDGWGYILLKDISDKKIEPKPEHKQQPTYTTEPVYTANRFRQLGSIHWGGRRWTWYSQKVLPGKGLKIPGRYVDKNGYVCDENNYICGASQLLSKGTIIDSPFGKKVKIYDWCDIESVDIYTNW